MVIVKWPSHLSFSFRTFLWQSFSEFNFSAGKERIRKINEIFKSGIFRCQLCQTLSKLTFACWSKSSNCMIQKESAPQAAVGHYGMRIDNSQKNDWSHWVYSNISLKYFKGSKWFLPQANFPQKYIALTMRTGKGKHPFSCCNSICSAIKSNKIGKNSKFVIRNFYLIGDHLPAHRWIFKLHLMFMIELYIGNVIFFFH